MVLGGLWHGAAWNFVIWGLFHGAILIGHRFAIPVLDPITNHAHGFWRMPWLLLRIASMFVLTCYGWLLFRATSLEQIVTMTTSLAQPLVGIPIAALRQVLILIAPLIVVQVIQYNSERLEFHRLKWLPKTACAVIYALMLYSIVFLGGTPQAFVYFQF